MRRSLLPRLEGRLNNSDLPMLLTPVAHYDGRDAHPSVAPLPSQS